MSINEKIKNYGLNWKKIKKKNPNWIYVIENNNVDKFIQECSIFIKLYNELLNKYQAIQNISNLIKNLHSDIAAIYETLNTIDQISNDIIDFYKTLKMKYPFYQIFDSLITDPRKDINCIRGFIEIIRNMNQRLPDFISIHLFCYRILRIINHP